MESKMNAMPERIWAHPTSNACVVSFTTSSADYNTEYVRADIVSALQKQARRQGMAIAAAIVVAGEGAEGLLGAAGYDTVDEMRRDGIDRYDIDLCALVLGAGGQDQ